MDNLGKKIVLDIVVCAIIGIIVVVMPVVLFINGVNFGKNAVEIAATVTHYTKERDRDGDVKYMIYYSFTVDERTYSGSYTESQMPYRMRKTVYYDPNNPETFRLSRHTYSIIMFVVSLFGIMLFLVSVDSKLMTTVRCASIKELLAHGKRIQATFGGVITTKKLKDGHRGYILTCKFRGETSGNEHLFKSGFFWEPLPKLGNGQVVPLVPVYVNNEKFKKYYVAVDEFIQAFPDLTT